MLKKEADINIQVPGTGCHNCLRLEMRMADPGLLIDGRRVSQREVPTVEMLLDWLRAVPV